jgi:hypothetical protein
MAIGDDKDVKHNRPDTLSDAPLPALPSMPALPGDEPLRPLLALLDEALRDLTLYRDRLEVELEWGGSPSPNDAIGLQARIAKAAAIFKRYQDWLASMLDSASTR